MKKVIVDEKTGRTRVVTAFDEKQRPSRVQQHHKDSTDLNKILKKYTQTGLRPSPKPGYYADLTKMKSYQESLDTVIRANEAFETLPANVRKEFNNNPAELVKFMADKKNQQRAIELGLIEKPIEKVTLTDEAKKEKT